MAKISLGDRMKLYEGFETSRAFLPLLPVMIRLDGKNFHTFTGNLKRPYDERLSSLMKEITRQLVIFSLARSGYTQSDEVTLVLHSESVDSQVFFDGSIFKTISVLAAFASATFNKLLPAYLPEKVSETPLFDCRAWNVPNKEEAVNCFIWREIDATSNSLSMAAQAYYPHEQLLGKSSAEKQEMLFSAGVNWNDYPSFFKRGVYFQRRKVLRKLPVTDIERLPPKHNARRYPELEFERTEIIEVDMQLLKVANKVEVIFEGQEPITALNAPDTGLHEDAAQAGL